MSDKDKQVKPDENRYRRIYTCIWNDEKFHRLSPNGKLAFLYMITHPNMTSLGVMRATVMGLSDELEVLPEAFQEVFREGLAEANREARCIYVKNFIKHQSPQSPNVIIAWAKSLSLVPECDLKDVAIQDAKAFAKALPKAFQEAFAKAFGNKDKGERIKERAIPTSEEDFSVDKLTGEIKSGVAA